MASIPLALVWACLSTTAAGGQSELALLQTLTQVDAGGAHAVAIGDASMMQDRGSHVRHLNSQPSTNAVTIVLVGMGVANVLISSAYFYRQRGETVDDPEDTRRCSTIKKTEGMSAATLSIGLGMLFLMRACTNQYVPNMPQMADEFNADNVMMSNTLISNWIIKAVCSMLTGPLSDHIGRRPVLVSASLMLFFGSLAGGFATSIGWFLAGRAIQGVGESVDGVVLAAIRDAYDDLKERDRIVTYSYIIQILGPLVAPFVGQAMTLLTGSWRASFFLFGGLAGLLYLLFVFKYEETCTFRRNEQGSYFEGATKVLLDRHLNVIFVVNLLALSLPMLYLSSFSFIIQDDFHKSPMAYALLMASNLIIAGAFGALIQASCKVTPFTKLRFGMFFFVLQSVAQILTAVFANPLGLWAMMANCWAGFSVGVPVFSALGVLYMEQTKDNAGLGGAMHQGAGPLVSNILVLVLTPVIIPYGPKALMLTASAIVLLASAVFWVCIGLSPPAWVYGEKDNDQVIESHKLQNQQERSDEANSANNAGRVQGAQAQADR